MLKAAGASVVAWNIEVGAEIKNIARAVGDDIHTSRASHSTEGGVEQARATLVASRSKDPELEQPCGFVEQVIEGAASIILWAGNDAFDKKGSVRDVSSSAYRDALNSPIRHIRHLATFHRHRAWKCAVRSGER